MEGADMQQNGHDVLTPGILASSMLQIGVGKGYGALTDGAEDTEIDDSTLPTQHQTNGPCSVLAGGGAATALAAGICWEDGWLASPSGGSA
jgi:hypothetical protein